MSGLLSDVLPAVYSGSNKLKRWVDGLLSDPVGLLAQTAGGLEDSARAHEALQRQAFANPQRPLQVTDQNALGQLGQNTLTGLLGFAPVGMIAKVVDALEYQGLHKPPMKGSGAPLHDLTGGGQYYPDDVYSPNGLQYYGTGDRAIDSEAWSLAMRVKDRPNAPVKMYRAVPDTGAEASKQIKELQKTIAYKDKFGFFPQKNDLSESFRAKYEGSGLSWDEIQNKAYQDMVSQVQVMRTSLPKPPPINHGDWVTTSRAYAKQHGEGVLGGNYKIISQTVPARKLFTNGDSWAEFGYDESGRALLEMLGLLGAGAGGAAYINSESGQNKLRGLFDK